MRQIGHKMKKCLECIEEIIIILNYHEKKMSLFRNIDCFEAKYSLGCWKGNCIIVSPYCYSIPKFSS